MNTQSSTNTIGPMGPVGCFANDLPLGAMNGPGLVLISRKHTRSCRCALARRPGGGAFASVHTNRPVSHTDRLMVADTHALDLVIQHARPLSMANSERLYACTELLCGARDAQTPALRCFGSAHPSGGPDASHRSVASAMTPDSHAGSPHRRGINDVSAHVGVRRPASFAA
jgi:hypothetical protein